MTQNEEDTQLGSTSPMKDDDVHPNPLAIVPAPHAITPIASNYEKTNKREFFDAMETDHEDNTTTSKKQKVESEGELIKVT